MSPPAPTVLIAGGGPAAVEGLLSLRQLLPEAELELVAPVEEFVYQPQALSEAFGGRPAARFSLREIAASARARYNRDAVTRVDTATRTCTLASGDHPRYNALLVAIGARPVEALPGAITFWGQDGDPALRRVLGAAREGEIGELAFAVPHRVPWSLPLYELALLTAADLHQRGLKTTLSLITPEPEPLAVFGGKVSAELARMLAEREIELRVSTDPVAYCAAAQQTVISLPHLVGRGLPGLPVDDRRFLQVDDFGRVLGAAGVYAAGDVTDSPIKQGGLGTQQADAAASAIAADLGSACEPEPFAAVLRGRILADGEARYLRRDLDVVEPAVVESSPLWWPGAKIFGRHLAPELARMAPAAIASARAAERPYGPPGSVGSALC